MGVEGAKAFFEGKAQILNKVSQEEIVKDREEMRANKLEKQLRKEAFNGMSPP